MPEATAFSVVYLVAAAISAGACLVVWQRRHSPGATSLALMLGATTLWAVADVIELQVSGVAGKRLVAQLQYVAVVATAPFFFHAAMGLAGRSERLSRRMLLAVWVVPVVSLAMAWTNPWHGWLWTDIKLVSEGSSVAIYEYGWWFWILMTHAYLLMVASTATLLLGLRRVGRYYRRAIVVAVVAVLAPWAGNVVYNFKLGPWPGLDWLVLSLGISGALLVWVVLREGLLDLLPRQRGALLEIIDDGVLLIDHDGHVMLSNEAARKTLGLTEKSLVTALGLESLRDLPAEWRLDVQVPDGAGHRWLDVRINRLDDRWGALAGRTVVARDVTLQKSLEDEREQLVDDLHAALQKVTQLEGLLPICAHCRKIRDDGGYWGRIEEYLGQRARVEFTHAICPDCVKELYPELADETLSGRSGSPPRGVR